MFPMLGPPRDWSRRRGRNNSKERQESSKHQINNSQSKKQQSSVLAGGDPTGSVGTHAKAKAQVKFELSHGHDQDQLSTKQTDQSSPLIVISFITRGSNFSDRAQGTELLFYKPKTSLTKPNQSNCTSSCLKKIQKPSNPTPWTFLFIEAGSTKDDKPDELSRRSIDRVLSPPDNKLQIVRISKPLRWNSTTTLVSLMYKIIPEEKKTKKVDWIKMGTESYYWSKIAGLYSAVENNLVSTALAAIYFPVALNIGYQEIFQQDSLGRTDLISLKVLEILCLCVQAGYARDGFRFYPTSAQPFKLEGNSDRDFKLRIWSYWTEVICWHLIRCKPTFEVSVQHSLNKVLAVVRPAVRDEKVTVEGLEKLMVETIAQEADRCRSSIENLVDHGLSEVLERSSISGPLHIFTLGSSSATYGILSNLVKYYLSRAKWKTLPTLDESTSTLSITITESRPFHEGVILANKLNEIIQAHQPNLTKSKSDKHFKQQRTTTFNVYDKDIREFYLDPSHQRNVEMFDGNSAKEYKPAEIEFEVNDQKISGRLDDLLKNFNASKVCEAEEVKFMIELTSEAAIWSAFMNCRVNGILLLAADRILPNGNAICKLGSASVESF
ncbi:hypothetical protein BY996DRAFT_7546234 [Phakopsora pachyrhizi]|nr:hypothetical protein BY996DRAFT_7546234 [Phakopsora pachyrhizi]